MENFEADYKLVLVVIIFVAVAAATVIMLLRLSMYGKIGMLIGVVINLVLFRYVMRGEDSNLLVTVLFGVVPGEVAGAIAGSLAGRLRRH